MIVLIIGENVRSDMELQFREAFDSLTSFCLKYTSNVVIAGNYWKALEKEHALIRVAQMRHLPYVPLLGMYEIYHEHFIAQIGDIVFGTRI